MPSQIEAIVMPSAPHVKSRARVIRTNRDRPYNRARLCGYILEVTTCDNKMKVLQG